MTWRETRQAVKAAVHETFGRAATYTRLADGAVVENITARLHLKTDTVGDGDSLDLILAQDRIVLRDDEISFTPARGDTVAFADEGITVEIRTLEPAQSPDLICYVAVL